MEYKEMVTSSTANMREIALSDIESSRSARWRYAFRHTGYGLRKERLNREKRREAKQAMATQG
jgi:hypothetical protein